MSPYVYLQEQTERSWHLKKSINIQVLILGVAGFKKNASWTQTSYYAKMTESATVCWLTNITSR